jgi:hypothetical protein
VAVSGGKAVLFHRLGDQELVEAMDAKTGVPLWKASFPTRYVSTISEDNGPRSTPVIQDGAVYVFGAEGNLHCLALDSGQARWSRAVHEDFNVPEGYFGAGSSPLVEGDKLLVNVGGRDGAGIEHDFDELAPGEGGCGAEEHQAQGQQHDGAEPEQAESEGEAETGEDAASTAAAAHYGL